MGCSSSAPENPEADGVFLPLSKGADDGDDAKTKAASKIAARQRGKQAREAAKLAKGKGISYGEGWRTGATGAAEGPAPADRAPEDPTLSNLPLICE